MTLEQLRIFAAVAEKQHVTQAARELNLTQSATSAAIASLEERYDIKLFDRIGRGHRADAHRPHLSFRSARRAGTCAQRGADTARYHRAQGRKGCSCSQPDCRQLLAGNTVAGLSGWPSPHRRACL